MKKISMYHYEMKTINEQLEELYQKLTEMTDEEIVELFDNEVSEQDCEKWKHLEFFIKNSEEP